MNNFVRSASVPVIYGHRKLQFFFEKTPSPSGEEDFDTWIDQAEKADEEWEMGDAVKK